MSALEEPQGTHNVVEIASGLNLYNESGITAKMVQPETPEELRSLGARA